MGAIGTGTLFSLTTCGLFFIFDSLVGASAEILLFASEVTVDTFVWTKVICPDDFAPMTTLLKELVEDGWHIISESWVVQEVFGCNTGISELYGTKKNNNENRNTKFLVFQF